MATRLKPPPRYRLLDTSGRLTPHRVITLSRPKALRESLRMDPQTRVPPRHAGFSQACGRGRPGASWEGMTGLLRALNVMRARQHEAFANPIQNLLRLTPPHRRAHQKGGTARGRIWNETTATGVEKCSPVSGRTPKVQKEPEGRRRDPTSRASLPLSPVQRPNPGPLPAQARLARSSEPILIPKLRI